MNEDYRKQQERKKKSYDALASVFSLSPFAMAYGYMQTGGELNWSFLLNAACAWVVCAVVYGISSAAYEHFYDSEGSNAWRVACVTAGIVFASLVILGRIFN